jgi:Ser/Thr protein kinase RdoA (MazF antagonist)
MGPEELGRFRLHRVLGRGGTTGVVCGEVWEAEDRAEGRRVALKIVRADDEAALPGLARFTAQARRLAPFRHPNFATVLDAGEAAGTSFVVMALVRGRSLAEASREGASATERSAWLRDVAEALASLHEAGHGHGDVKAENVLVRDDGSACLVDLGASFDEDASDGAADDWRRRDQAAWARVAREVLAADAPDGVLQVVERAASEDGAIRLASMADVVAALPVPRDGASRFSARERAFAPRRTRSAIPGGRTLSPWVAVALFAALVALAVLLQRALLD